MQIERISTLCPYLTSGPEGIFCNAVSNHIRNIQDISTDNCLSRHFEVCHIYVEKLYEVAFVFVEANPWGDV